MRDQKKYLVVILLVFVLFLPAIAIVSGIMLHRIHVQAYEDNLSKAKECYDAGEFAQAIEIYEKARSSRQAKDSDLVQPLAECLCKVGDYGEAAKLLENYYKKSGDLQVKEQLTQVFTQMDEANYSKAMERGKLFYKSKEYDKAIRWFTNALKNEPDKIEAVELLIKAYIAQGNPKKAQEVYHREKVNYQAKEVEELKQVIEKAMKDQTYEELLTKAEELYHAGTYEECFDTYKKAIALCPSKLKGYKKIVKAYQSLRRYDEAILLLKERMSENHSQKLQVLLENCKTLKNNESIRYEIFEKLYDAFQQEDTEIIYNILNSSDYTQYMDSGNTVYYCRDSENVSEAVPMQEGMIIYKSGYIYCGDFKDGERSGHGCYFSLADTKRGYTFYSGTWRNGLPNGAGKYDTTMKVTYHGVRKEYETVVEGKYSNGYEHGKMKRTLYQEGEYFGTLNYQAVNGIPQQAEEESQTNAYWNIPISYCIGSLDTTTDSIKYYYIKTAEDFLWQIDGL